MKKQGMIAKAARTLNRNSPTILTGMGVAGVLSTAVLAVGATPKALMILDDHRFEELDKKDIVQLTWRCYIPAAIMGGISIACIISANSVNLKRNAALASVYSLTDKTLREYQSKVVEVIGENKANKIKDDIAKDYIENDPVGSREIQETDNGETLCYDATSGRYFRSDIDDIRRALNELNRQLLNDSYMFVTLNEAYFELGLSSTKTGDLLGWHMDDGTIEPSFSSQITEDGKPCVVFDFSTEPRYIAEL